MSAGIRGRAVWVVHHADHGSGYNYFLGVYETEQDAKRAGEEYKQAEEARRDYPRERYRYSGGRAKRNQGVSIRIRKEIIQGHGEREP